MPVPSAFEGRCAIGAVGLVTSLGLDAATACAAARAGLNRAAQLENFKLKSPDGEVVGITGHAVPIVTHGFEGYARLLRLAEAALADLRRNLRDQVPAQASFYVAVPDPLRRFSGSGLLVDDALKADYAQEQAEADPLAPPADMARVLLARAAVLSGWRQPFELRYVDSTGHTGVARALRVALGDLHAGRTEVAVVGGIDSLHGDRTLKWLYDTGRLKSPAIAAGLQPGEAAAFFTLRAAVHAAEAPDIAHIESLHMADESQPLLSGQRPLGDGLARALFSMGTTARWTPGHTPWIVSDHNGEPYRAYDWGHACSRLRRAYAQLGQGPVWHTAEAFGDTGCASGAVSLITASVALRRGYAPANAAIVLSSSDGCSRTALRIAQALQ